MNVLVGFLDLKIRIEKWLQNPFSDATRPIPLVIWANLLKKHIDMKYFYTLVVCLVINLQVEAQLPAYVPSNGLVGWYGFSGNANDASPTGNNGAVINAVLANDRFGNLNNV